MSRDDRVDDCPTDASVSTTVTSRIRRLVRAPLVRYVIVGLASNGLLYATYLALTFFGMGHKVAMTVVFVVGIVQTFAFNRSWTFRSESARGPALIRYSFVYGCGYAISWMAMWVFVDRLGYPHQLVQLALIVIVAVFIFVNLKYWVFRAERSAPVRTFL